MFKHPLSIIFLILTKVSVPIKISLVFCSKSINFVKKLTMVRIRNKAFEEWLYEEVETAFGLTRLFAHPFLNTLKEKKISPTVAQSEQLEKLRSRLFEYVDSWNEDEIKFLFISPLIDMVDYKSTHYKVFTQRPMSVAYENGTKTTLGKVEFMIATGKQKPRKPFFFLHEYKQENRRDNDPLGQLLIAMVAAQVQNEDGKPLYGCYVSGRSWFFVVLDNKQYAVSSAYDASDEVKIAQILAILFYLKELSDIYFS
jgi:hypothetical protein